MFVHWECKVGDSRSTHGRSALRNKPDESGIHLFIHFKGPRMDAAKEFRNHATICESMARSTREVESRAAWVRMAERWILCANLAEEQDRRIQAGKERQPVRRTRIAPS